MFECFTVDLCNFPVWEPKQKLSSIETLNKRKRQENSWTQKRVSFLFSGFFTTLEKSFCCVHCAAKHLSEEKPERNKRNLFTVAVRAQNVIYLKDSRVWIKSGSQSDLVTQLKTILNYTSTGLTSSNSWITWIGCWIALAHVMSSRELWIKSFLWWDDTPFTLSSNDPLEYFWNSDGFYAFFLLRIKLIRSEF